MSGKELLAQMETVQAEQQRPVLMWLGQAGLCIRTAGGRVLLVDPYLSDEVEKVYGYRRITPAPIAPEDVAADLVLITHWHEDHLDGPSVRALEKEGTLFVGPQSCCTRLMGRGVAAERTRTIAAGETLTVGDVTITATPARHEVPGYLSEDAVGFLLEFDGFTLYNVGDTEYERRLVAAAGGRIDLCVVPINGSGGNIDAYEAAFLTWRLDCAAVMPVHVGMWADKDYGEGATLDPALFESTYRQFGGEAEVVVPETGEVYVLGDTTVRRDRGEALSGTQGRR